MDYEKLSGDRVGETSEAIRARVQAARDIQQKRFSNNGSSDAIADMHVGEIRQFIGACLSPHPFDRLRTSLKLARTIANLTGSEEIQSPHLVEALQYRPKIMM
jgi:magnesium chelatase family protein